MLDDDMDMTLIEVNSNPCLEFACPLLERLLTELIEGVFEKAVDTHFPPPAVNERTRKASEAVAEIKRLKIERERYEGTSGGFEEIVTTD